MSLFIFKRCTTCNTDLPINEFRKQSKNKDGRKYTCRICDDARAKKRYSEKKEHIIATVKEWQNKNPDKMNKYKETRLAKIKNQTQGVVAQG